METKTKTILACKLCNGNCLGCFYADICNQYNDIAPYNPLEIIVDDKENSNE